jgi:hypothetical protein
MITECRHFETCNAPLCPMYKDQGVWHPDEDVCIRNNAPKWVKLQRKMKKAGKLIPDENLYTIAMLKVAIKSTKGINVNKMRNSLPETIDKWLCKRVHS